MNGVVSDSVSGDAVYTGFWINHSQPQISGTTLTLRHRDAGLLTAFLALFVAVTGRSCWRLFCFAAHAFYSAALTPQDGLYHQRQAVLRNATTEVDGLEYFVKLAWHWRRKTGRLWLRIIPMISITAIMITAFYVASIFSSQISTAEGNEVLIKSPNCGLMGYWEATTQADFYGDFLQYSSRLNTAGAAYAQQCYNSNASIQDCSFFVKQELPATISTNASCPFPGKGNICLRDFGNVHIDTGIIDSHSHLGINALPGDRIGYRRVLDCAPLTTHGYTQISDGKDQSSQLAYIEYFYGAPTPPSTLANVTYRYLMNRTTTSNDDKDYTMDVEHYTAMPIFVPIPELRRNDADMFLIFLSGNEIKYLQPVNDDWYSAHRRAGALPGAGGHPASEVHMYGFDQPATVMGCAYQQSICDPSKDACTPLSSRNNTPLDTYPWDTEKQNYTASVFLSALEGVCTQPEAILESMGVTALTARHSLTDGIQGPLPSDQWQREVMYWHAITMAKFQRAALELATGPSDAFMERYVQRPTTDAGKQVCQSQKIRSSSHTSFSVLGLALTLTLGLCIIILAHTLEPLLRLVQRWRRKSNDKTGTYRTLEWATNEFLQLQRLAHEELGSGTWTGTANGVPVTGFDERLAVLDVSDERHPTMVYLREVVDEKGDGGSSLDGGVSSRDREKRVERVEIENCADA